MKIALLICLGLVLTGCAVFSESIGYYWQSASGHLSIMRQAKPIDQWIADPQTKPALKNKLSTVRDIRAYASRELGLPDNGSYKSYADLKRASVVYNVLATPELSMQMRQWCFPVVGCVTYRGYYDKDAAEGFAQGLRAQGDDVYVGGVPAYSTLGYFDDPLLNTFINYPDAELARLVFHELSHQVVYIKSDTTFNESFATAVETLGVEQWLAAQNNPALTKDYQDFAARRADFLALLKRYRFRLEQTYIDAGSANPILLRQQKAQVFEDLKAEYDTIKIARWNGFTGYDRWFAQPLTNAHLAAIATYTDLVPGFIRLARDASSDAKSDASSDSVTKPINFPQFYLRVKALSQLDKAQRDKKLISKN